MKIASVAEVKDQLSAFLKASEAGPVVVTRNGKAVAMIVAVQDDDEVERLLMAHSPRLQAILEASRKQIRGNPVSLHLFRVNWYQDEATPDFMKRHRISRQISRSLRLPCDSRRELRSRSIFSFRPAQTE